MNNDRYTKAPVSELILGVTTSRMIISIDDLFLIRDVLKDKYPIIEIMPLIADENMQDYKIITEVDVSKTGQFLLRLRSSDKRWLVQIQGNKIYLNWIRHDDEEEVGDYPGFTFCFQKYQELLTSIVS